MKRQGLVVRGDCNRLHWRYERISGKGYIASRIYPISTQWLCERAVNVTDVTQDVQSGRDSMTDL